VITTEIAKYLPSRRDYSALPATWKSDILAGLTVGVVALPLALAFGVSSGVGAEAGIVTAIVAGIVAAVFGGSHVQVSGPTGAMVVVLAPVVATHGAGALATVTLMAGLLVIVGGVLHLGRVVGSIPWPVIEGFTAGIAIIIFLQQVPALLGSPATSHDSNAALAAWEALRATTVTQAAPTLLIGLGVAVIMVATRLLNPRIPGSLLAVVGASVVVVVSGITVPVIGELPSSLATPALPLLSADAMRTLAGPAVAIAALAAIESLLSARVASLHSDTGPYDADRELVGQGLASVASSLFGGMPATGAIARTAVNVRTGGRTRVAAIVHAVTLLVVVMTASTLVADIPLAALAGILMVTAVTMVPARAVLTVVKTSRQSAGVFALTAAVTVAVDLVYAVVIGILAAAFFALRSLSRTAGVHREPLPGDPLPGDERIALFRIDGALFFGAADRVLERVATIHGVEVVILRMSQVQLLDATGAQVLAELVVRLHRRGIAVLVKGIQPQHLTLATRAGLLRAIGDDARVFDTLEPAVDYARSLVAGTVNEAR
jgi:SulP family sulfate permease